MIGAAQSDVMAIHAAFSRYVSDINYTTHAALDSAINYKVNNPFIVSSGLSSLASTQKHASNGHKSALAHTSVIHLATK